MACAVGFFDGVHLGHRDVLDGADRVCTFDPHPRCVLGQADAPKLIMTLAERVACLRANGARAVEVIPFTPTLAALSPEDFAARYFRPGERIRCTDRWRFGARGAGDAETLRRLGHDVDVVPMVTYGGDVISSTRIRTAVAAGRLEDARAMMGRAFARSGAIFRGKGLGGRLGFPTVNLRLDGANALVMPPNGVHAVVADGARGVANFGLAPTCGERAWPVPTLEIHFIDSVPVESEGRNMRVEFLRFLRPERRFESLEALARQIREDEAAVRRMFSTAKAM